MCTKSGDITNVDLRQSTRTKRTRLEQRRTERTNVLVRFRDAVTFFGIGGFTQGIDEIFVVRDDDQLEILQTCSTFNNSKEQNIVGRYSSFVMVLLDQRLG